MADVAELCPRVILIHHGRLLYDGLLGQLSDQLAPFKLIRLTLDRENGGADWRQRLPEGTAVLDPDPANLTLRVPRRETSAITAYLLNTLPVVDLSVENPPLEAVIDQIYQEAAV